MFRDSNSLSQPSEKYRKTKALRYHIRTAICAHNWRLTKKRRFDRLRLPQKALHVNAYKASCYLIQFKATSYCPSKNTFACYKIRQQEFKFNVHEIWCFSQHMWASQKFSFFSESYEWCTNKNRLARNYSRVHLK